LIEQADSFWDLLTQEIFRVVSGDSKRDEIDSWTGSLTPAKETGIPVLVSLTQ